MPCPWAEDEVAGLALDWAITSEMLALRRAIATDVVGRERTNTSRMQRVRDVHTVRRRRDELRHIGTAVGEGADDVLND